MNKNEIEALLVERSKISAEIAQFNMGYAEMRRKLIPDEVQKELDDLDAESNTALKGIQEKLEKLDENIKKGTLEIGESVTIKGVGGAIYNHGRVIYDNKALDGLLVAIPELAKFRKEGEPYITIR